jgi:hypothetical protein
MCKHVCRSFDFVRQIYPKTLVKEVRMQWFQRGLVGFALVLGLAVSGCNKDSSGGVQQDSIGKLDENSKVSECGGFESDGKMQSVLRTKDEECRDELLRWSYDRSSRIVTFLNENVWLNCCGERAIGITLDEATGRYELRETDAPGEGRCLCSCFFDFSVGLPNIPEQSIYVALFRHVTDTASEQRIWQGTLSLEQKTGEIVIQKNVGLCE